MAKKKLKRYKVSPTDSVCFAVSVVDNPAIESDFQFFSKQKVEKFVGVDGERRMIYGCALRPDFPIYRRNDDEEFYLEFSKEAIDKISKEYFKMGFQSNWTEAHKDEVEGLSITESWIKEDMELDKSVALGLDKDLPVGSWFIGCHCENDDIWASVKEGKYHGFSVEALISLEEFEKQEDNNDINKDNMDNMQLFEKIKEFITELFNKNEEVKLEGEQAPQATETTTPEPTPEPTVVEEPTAVVEEPEPEPTVVEEPKEEPKQDEAPKVEDLSVTIGNLLQEIKQLREMNGELVNKVNSLGSQPSSKPINTNGGGGGHQDTYSAWRDEMAKYL